MDHNYSDKKGEYKKFYSIIIAIVLTSGLMTILHDGGITYFMRMTIGVFFLVFSLFKIFNLKNFVPAYQQYDILAKRSIIYAYVYPFIELLLAFGYLMIGFGIGLHLTTAILMVISSIGIFKAMKEPDHTIMCACLGTFIKLPVTKITLVEDLAMSTMALLMIIIEII
ncbi:hypothetical protein KC717_03455 [Candidatus Dojkabacteria bacterium]|uniref:Methylamine utilisation protein MauE domain-containing protein n=1 Tax=Candidatus Dojkabacteria bacterium TaxID=2099670 RepID=A0A955L8N3_9BACT|nr:hypothetical protein [Candidatus Dojkabacteria bacterium]